MPSDVEDSDGLDLEIATSAPPSYTVTVTPATDGKNGNQFGGASNNSAGYVIAPSFLHFNLLYLLMQACGIAMIALMAIWLTKYMGGLSWKSDPTTEFGWHPLLMTIGLIFLYGNSILIYRGLRYVSKMTLKITHATIHLLALLFTLTALYAILQSKNLAVPPMPNWYSLHSWLGIGTVLLFCLQYIFGFMAYLLPCMGNSFKAAYMAWHVYFGLLGFVAAIATAMMGITEKALWSVTNYDHKSDSGVMVNIVGLLFVVFGSLVVYLATNPAYKRQPLAKEMPAGSK